MASITITETATTLGIEEKVVNLALGEFIPFSGKYTDLTEVLEPINILGTRIDKVIQTKNIGSMVYNGGSNNDKLSTIVYSDNYTEDLIYDGNDKLQYIDHKLSGTVEGYTTLTYSNGSLATYTFTEGARV